MHVTEALRRTATSKPGRLATVHGERSRTYAEQLDRVSRLAQAFSALGVQPDDRVAILSSNSDRYIESLLAMQWAGVVVVPLDLDWTIEVLTEVLDASRSSVLLIDSQNVATARVLAQKCPALRSVIHCGDEPVPQRMLDLDNLIASHEPIPDTHPSGGNAEYALYSVDDDGKPVELLLDHRTLLDAAEALDPGHSPGGVTVLLQAVPMSDWASLVVGARQTLLGGTQVVIESFEPKSLLEAIDTHYVGELLVSPATLPDLIEEPHAATADAALHRVLYAGTEIPGSTRDRVEALFPGVRLARAYTVPVLVG